MKTSFLLLFVLTMFSCPNLWSQGIAINNTGLPADSCAILDVSSDSKGILIPRMTITQRNAITGNASGLVEGLMIYQTDSTPGYYYFNGISWGIIGAAAISINDLNDGKTGGGCVFMGDSAGHNDPMTTVINPINAGNCNTAIGDHASYTNTFGYNNTAIGYYALFTGSSGPDNTAVGHRALYYKSIGQGSTAIGSGALHENTTGNNNTGFGKNVNFHNQEGSNNTIVGSMAGMGTTLHNKSGNVFLGYMAGYSETSDNKLYIENSNSTLPLIYGDFDNDLLKFNGSVELVNGFSPSSLKFYEPGSSGTNSTKFQSQAQSADVTYTLPASDGNNGQVLSTDGNGMLSWKSYSIGDFAQGGIVFWVDESGLHGLACTKINQGNIRWFDGGFSDTEAHGDGIGAGEMNTMLIIADQSGDCSLYAAGLCANLTVIEGGNMYGDWYLPSQEELNLMYLNKTSIDLTAVDNGGAAFSPDTYWSSTEMYDIMARSQYFVSGAQSSASKHLAYNIRAVRAF